MNYLITLIVTLLRLHQSTNIKQDLLLCKNIIYPEWKRLWVSFSNYAGLKIWYDNFENLKYFSAYSFGKQYKNVLLSCQISCWSSFYMLVTFCNVLLMPLFYLYSCSVQPLYIGMLFPHCFLLFFLLVFPDFDSMHFVTFYYLWNVFNSKLVCASNRAGWELNPSGLSPTFVSQHVRTRSLNCENENFWCFYILINMKLLCDLWCYRISSCCIGGIS